MRSGGAPARRHSRDDRNHRRRTDDWIERRGDRTVCLASRARRPLDRKSRTQQPCRRNRTWRGRAAESFDISADLTALGKTPVICVCAGGKAILDLPKTVEHLETLGVPILGYGTDEFAAFYSRSSGLPVDARVETPAEAAAIAVRHWRMGSSTAVLVCVPVPAEFEISSAEIEEAIDRAVIASAEQGIRGKAVTPFLLSELEKLTAGKTLEANRALLVNNASIAASIAVNLSR